MYRYEIVFAVGRGRDIIRTVTDEPHKAVVVAEVRDRHHAEELVNLHNNVVDMHEAKAAAAVQEHIDYAHQLRD